MATDGGRLPGQQIHTAGTLNAPDRRRRVAKAALALSTGFTAQIVV